MKHLIFRSLTPVLGLSMTLMSTFAFANPAYTGTSQAPASYTGAKSFGISAGVSYLDATGNRGKLIRTDQPALDVKLNFRLSNTATLRPFFLYGTYYFPTLGDASDYNEGTLAGYGLGLQWNPFTRWVVQPYLGLSVGHFMKSENDSEQEASRSDGEAGFSLAFGLNVPVITNDSFLYLEGQAFFMRFDDQFSSAYATQGMGDLSGLFYSASAGMTLML
ncbi:MAG: hypothetical protein IT285_06140 [Bdellovibrionales bacterium]|nr:hypothetical protein [Bdellovibrionales bacterium]